MATDRFYVDERAGCIAVRDREVACDSPGLHEDTPGVIRFWMGEWRPQRCSACGRAHGGVWVVSEELRAEARELCDRLNEAVEVPSDE